MVNGLIIIRKENHPDDVDLKLVRQHHYISRRTSIVGQRLPQFLFIVSYVKELRWLTPFKNKHCKETTTTRSNKPSKGQFVVALRRSFMFCFRPANLSQNLIFEPRGILIVALQRVKTWCREIYRSWDESLSSESLQRQLFKQRQSPTEPLLWIWKISNVTTVFS